VPVEELAGTLPWDSLASDAVSLEISVRGGLDPAGELELRTAPDEEAEDTASMMGERVPVVRWGDLE
jgi:hypothetical protein